MILSVLMLCSFAVATAEFVLVGLLPQIAGDLAVSLPVAGQLVTGYMLVVTVGGPVASILTRRLPRRGLLAATMALAAASAGACAMADSYTLLFIARLGSALAQALFMAVASQVAVASVADDRKTAAVARVFGGFALATVIGLPLGTLIGQAWGWHIAFVSVAIIAGVGLSGVLVFCPKITAPDAGSAGSNLRAVLAVPVLRGLTITLLVLTGFVMVFTYVAPILRQVSGFSPGWVSVALLGYGLGTVIGNLIGGRVPPPSIAGLLPAPVVALAVILLAQVLLLRHRPAALAGLILLGGAAFMIVPLVQTWLMGSVQQEAAGLIAAVNISVAGVAGALGAALGGVVSARLGLAWVSPLAAVPVVVAVALALDLRRHHPTGIRIGTGHEPVR